MRHRLAMMFLFLAIVGSVTAPRSFTPHVSVHRSHAAGWFADLIDMIWGNDYGG